MKIEFIHPTTLALSHIFQYSECPGVWALRTFPQPQGHKKNATFLRLRFVRIIGLEPTRLAAPDPKSGMSTNFTISAKCECKYNHTFRSSNKKSKKNIQLVFPIFGNQTNQNNG